MAATIIEFPFDAGAYEAADREWLPPNLFSVVENLRLDRDGRLGIRPGNTALGQTTYSASAMTAFDLANYNGRLVALGDVSGQGAPTDLFEFLGPAVTSAATWRATSGDVSGPGRLPRATNVRELGRLPDQNETLTSVQVAAGAGYVCGVFVYSSYCVVHVFDPSDDQTILLTQIFLEKARVVFAGSDFWVVGQNNTNDDIEAYNFDPLTDTGMAGPVTMAALAAGITDLSLAQSAGGASFVIVYALAPDVFARQVSSAGTVTHGWTVVTGATAQSVAIASLGTGNGALVAVLRQSIVGGAYALTTFTLNGVGGAAITAGPTAVFGGAASLGFFRASMCVSGTGASVIMVGAEQSSPTTNTLVQDATVSTHTLGTLGRIRDAVSKTSPVCPIGSTLSFVGAVNCLAAGDSLGTNQFFVFERTNPRPLAQIQKDGTLAGPLQSNNSAGINGAVAVGTRVYWANTIQGASGTTGQITEFDLGDSGRRQMACVANELHIAGAMPTVYDGRNLVEQGFAERPVCRLAQNTTGQLTLLATYFVRVTWEVTDARGLILRSQGSNPVAITLTGANDSIDVVATTPHSLRLRAVASSEVGQSVRVGIYRTTAGGANFILDTFVDVPLGTAGALISATLTRSDASLTEAGVVIYEQAQTPLAHVSPPPYRYTWQARERQLIGGLPSGEQWQFSKLLFPSEPVEFATLGRLSFTGRANKDITAVGAFETVGITWTSDEIAIIPGSGPDHSGLGEFDSSLIVPSPGGCLDWRSLVNAPPGFFFQMTADKLMLLARGQQGAGEVSWAGQPVRETLALFPVITGGVHVRTQMIVAFSCTNVAGNAGRILIYDLRRNVWYVDTVGPATSVSELNGRLAFIQAGVVFLQDTAAGFGAFPGAVVQTGFQAVTKRLGWGHIYRLGLLGTDLGACSVQCLIDVDDGVGLRDLGTETFTGTGQTFERFWSLPTAAQRAARFSARFVLSSASSNTLGVSLKAWAAEVQGSPNMVRVGSGGFVS